MAHRIPIQQDDLSFEERQSKVWEDMEKDMERRRKEWEDEIEHMRGSFFHLKPDTNGGKIDALTDKMTSDDAKSVIEKDQHGRPVFRARFNVCDYQPEEVNVKMEANKLIVNAKHEEKGGNKSVSREYSREINIPNEIDQMALHCTISADGVLTVEAPMPVPTYPPVADNPSGMTSPRVISTVTPSVSSTPPRGTPPMGIQVQNVPPPPRGTPPIGVTVQNVPPPTTHTSTFTTFMSPKGGTATPPQYPGSGISMTPTFTSGTSSPHVVNTNNLQRTFSAPSSHVSSSSTSTKFESRSGSQSPSTLDKDKKYKVEIDIEDFNPEDLNVKTVDKKLVISARKEERVGTRTSTKELNREFNLPETVDPMTIKAFFSDSGKLLIEAPYLRPIAVGHFGEGREGSPHFGMGSPLAGR